MMKTPTMNSRSLGLSAIGALVASLALVGCSRNDEVDSKPSTTDNVVAQAKQKGEELKNDAAAGLDKAKDATRDMAQDAKQAGEKAGDKVADAVITTAVNAELAKDSKLSALKIDVDTDAGRVALKGTAPSNEAREHATTLASNVKGVVSVDNQLTVEPGKM